MCEYTYDDKGYPLAKTVTETPSYGEDLTPTTTEYTYDYELDGSGRLIKATSSDKSEGSAELSYDGEGNVVSSRLEYVERDYGSDNQDATLTYVDEYAYASDGTMTGCVTTVTNDAGDVVIVTENRYDDQENLVGPVETRPQGKGDDLVSTTECDCEYDEDGNLLKKTTVKKGDGETTEDVYRDGETYVATCMPDGSVSVAKREHDDEGKPKLGKAKVYDGPYEVDEYTYDEAGELTSRTSTSYDGTVEIAEFTYDEHGNEVSYRRIVKLVDGEARTESIWSTEYVHVDELSEYLEREYDSYLRW